MKKENYYKLFYGVSILFAVGFAIGLLADYVVYDERAYSAPFYVFALVRGIEFLIPGMIALGVAIFMKKKYR